MERLQIASLNMIGARGLDRRSDVSDIDAAHALELLNIDLFPAGDAGRLAARRWFKRFGQGTTNYGFTAAAAAGAGLGIGEYHYRIVKTEAGPGPKHISTNVSVTTTGGNQQVNLATLGGAVGAPVDIYRTAVNPTVLTLSNYKLVTSGVTGATFTDTVADGSLGAALTANSAYGAVDPLGNSSFNQTALVDRVRFWKTRQGTPYLIFQARTAGAGSAANQHYCQLDLAEPPIDYSDAFTIEDVATLGNMTWATGTGTPSSIYYSAGATVFSAASQPATPTAPGVAVGAAGALTGTYKYVVQTKNTSTGILSVPSTPSAAVVPAGNKVNVSGLPGGGATWRLYRTSASGEFFQFLLESTGTTYTDNTTDDALSQSTVPYDVGAAGGFKFIESHKGVLFVGNKLNATASSSLVRWSSSARPFNFPSDPLEAPGYEFEINPDDGDSITGLKSFGPLLIVFKRRMVFAISGDPPTGFRWDPITGAEGAGCVSNQTIAHTSAGLMWLSPNGVCLMPEPGAKPVLVSDPIREVFIESQRLLNDLPSQSISFDRPEVRDTFSNLGPESAAFHFQAQFSTDNFATIAFDYDTQTSAELGYFRADNGAFPSAGKTLLPGQAVQVAVLPPTGGPTAGTTYSVRLRAWDGLSWGLWRAMPDFLVTTMPYRQNRISSENETLAFAVDYYPRNEYWLWIPTAGKSYGDMAYILNYGPLSQGGEPLWRRAVVPACSACVTDPVVVEGNTARQYMFVGSPDGLVWIYPWVTVGLDCLGRTDVADADLVVSAVISGGTTVTATGTAWPTDQYKLKGGIAAVLASDYEVYIGIITNNTATVLTMAWLEGRTPPNGAATVGVGGVGQVVESSWLALTDSQHAAILRQVNLQAGPGLGALHLTVRSTNEPGEMSHVESATVRRFEQDVQLGGGARQNRIFPHLRGHRHQIRLAGVGVRQLWELHEIGLSYEETGARL